MTTDRSCWRRLWDPAPLGLAGFALTTFLLSAANAGWTRGATALNSAEWLPYALAYGGVAQLLAGMWELPQQERLRRDRLQHLRLILDWAVVLCPVHCWHSGRERGQ